MLLFVYIDAGRTHPGFDPEQEGRHVSRCPRDASPDAPDELVSDDEPFPEAVVGNVGTFHARLLRCCPIPPSGSEACNRIHALYAPRIGHEGHSMRRLLGGLRLR